ncbi:MAG TPA: SpoIIE family protein phosphatase [Bacteroidia bacterium]|jgi:serine phosphatase RsbU (regulator of sigma subunit)
MRGIIFKSLVFLFSLHGVSFAQSSGYFIKNYYPKDYKGYNQMWHAIQDKNGLLYFASTSNVFIFSGTHWEAIPIKSGSAVRQIAVDSATGTIYTGVAGDFGYLERNTLGKWQYVSIVEQLSKEQRDFNDLWKIIPLNGDVYFQSSERIIIVRDKKVTSVIEAPPDKKFALSFVSNNRFYVRQRTVGIMELSGNRLTLIPGGELFADKRVLAMVPYGKDQNLVLTGDDGMFRMQINKPLPPEQFRKDKFLLGSGVLGCQWVNDSVLAINSRSGIAFYDKQIYFKETINKDSGLSDEVIAELFVDREQNIWLMHNNGISFLGYNALSFIYTDKIGFKGTPEFLKKLNGVTYLACSGGLFKVLQDSVSHSLKAIPTEIANTEVWDLHSLNNTLYVATSNGLMTISGDRAEMLTDNLTNRITSVEEKNKLVTAEKGGFSVIDVKPGKKPVTQQYYEIVGQELLKIGRVDKCKGEEDLYETWAVSRQKKIFNLKFGVEQNKLIVRAYDTLNGIRGSENYIVYVGDSTFICDASGCDRYVAQKDVSPSAVCFENAYWIFNKLREAQCPDLRQPYDFRLCFSSSEPSYTTCFGYGPGNTVISKRVKLGSIFIDNSLQCSIIQPDGVLWALTHEFFATYNTNAVRSTPYVFRAIVQKVLVGKDSVIFMGSDDQNIINPNPIAYSNNSIAFNFDAPIFKQHNQLYFSCRLDGYDTTWSKPSLITDRYYTNLYEGTYTFRVRCVDSYGNMSTEDSYTFTISPPWYRTYTAYFLYFLLFLVVMYLTIRITAMRLRRQKEKLELIVKERTAEVVSQKHMLETAYIEIKDSIRYAKRIQNALLASDKLLKEYLDEYFIYYKPKDIVSGDFYWAQPKGDWFYMITADCTGHGVPGAFMSLLNISFLNETINASTFVTPDQVLGEVRAQIIEALRSDGSEEGGKDGMDCVLCAYNFKTRELLFSAANNPLWICRNKAFIEFKPDKFPVGKHDRENEPFRLQKVSLNAGDIVYTFTDGYADQFGGPDGKKFKIKQLKELLLSIAHLPMNEQKDVVSKTIRKWKKGIDQIDDVLVIGVKIL